MKPLLLFGIVLLAHVAFSQPALVEEIKISKQLTGDLYLAGNKKTIVLLVPGSGPTDRNGNTPGLSVTNCLKFLAEGIAGEGYDVFTYDKRVVHMLKNKTEIGELDFKHGIDDAEEIMHYLRDSLDYSNIVVTGHSEGALIGMIAARKQKAKAFVAIASPSQTIDLTLRQQINKQAPALNDASDAILKELKNGNTVTQIPMMLQSVYALHNQPYLIDWMRYNPTEEIEKLHMPVLIISGSKDLQVEPDDAQRLARANTQSETVAIESMNHILKKIENDSDNLTSYNEPELPIHPKLVEIIVNFLKKNP